MENDTAPEGPFDFSTSTQMGHDADQIQSAIDRLKKEVKEEASAASFPAKIDAIKQQIDQLQASGAPLSQTIDLESQLQNIKHTVGLKVAEAPSAPPLIKNEEMDRLVQEALEHHEELSDAQLEKVEKMAKEFLTTGKPLKEILKLSDEAIETIYAHAYFLYQSAKYKEASHVFWILNGLVPDDVRFYMGIAACRHRQKKYFEAATTYIIASVMDLENPFPAYYLSDCQIEMGLFELAKESLQQVIERGAKNKEHQVLVDRAKLTLDKLNQEHPSPLKQN